MNPKYDPIYLRLPFDSMERHVITELSTIYVNFIIHGNPNPIVGKKFLPITKTDLNFLDIRADGLFPGMDPFADRMLFWDEIIKNYNTKLFS